MNRQKLILTILLALFACSLVYSLVRMPRQKTVDRSKYQGSQQSVGKPLKVSPAEDSARVRLDLLDRAAGAYRGGGRNVFRGEFSGEVKKPRIPLPPPPPPPAQVTVPPPPAAVSPPAQVEPTQLQRDMANFTFLGFLKKDTRKTIFLSNGKEIFLVKKGDRIAGKYDVASLTDEALTITSILDGGEILIPLVENKPLSAPRK